MLEREYHADRVYLNGLREIFRDGHVRSDRTGTGTIGIFGGQNRYDLTAGFPLLTSKKVYTRGVFGELLFFLNGRTDNQWLNDRRIRIWDEWQSEDGDLGPIYGYQWRFFGADYVPQAQRDAGVHPGGTDQLRQLLLGLRDDPFSRRHIVSAWNPGQIGDMALPPCHTMFQFYVAPDEDGNPAELSCQLYQRSADAGLGEPFNIASYAALTHLLADLTGLRPGHFVHTFGDHHIYLNHVSQLREQLDRESFLPPMPSLRIEHPVRPEDADLEDPALFAAYEPECFIVEGYEPLPAIRMDVSV